MPNNNTLKERVAYDVAKEKLKPYIANLINIIESRQRPRPDGSIDWSKTLIDINRLFEHLIQQAKEEERQRIVEMIGQMRNGQEITISGMKMNEAGIGGWNEAKRYIINQLSNTK